jgi:hypothetical protein
MYTKEDLGPPQEKNHQSSALIDARDIREATALK